MSESHLIKLRLSLKGRPIKTFAFTKEVITIGRDPASDVFLDNPGISREHLKLELMPNGHYRLMDMASANGTFLNDERVKTAYVYNSDVIRLGKFTLWVAVERDRREQREPDERRVSPEANQGTMLLSPTEMDRLMSLAREEERVPPHAQPSAPRAPAKRAPPARAARGRPHGVVVLLIGVVFLLATAVGAGAAWLLLR